MTRKPFSGRVRRARLRTFTPRTPPRPSRSESRRRARAWFRGRCGGLPSSCRRARSAGLPAPAAGSSETASTTSHASPRRGRPAVAATSTRRFSGNRHPPPRSALCTSCSRYLRKNWPAKTGWRLGSTPRSSRAADRRGRPCVRPNGSSSHAPGRESPGGSPPVPAAPRDRARWRAAARTSSGPTFPGIVPRS